MEEQERALLLNFITKLPTSCVLITKIKQKIEAMIPISPPLQKLHYCLNYCCPYFSYRNLFIEFLQKSVLENEVFYSAFQEHMYFYTTSQYTHSNIFITKK